MVDTNTPAPAEKEAKPVAETQPSNPEEVKNELPTQAEEEESDWEELDGKRAYLYADLARLISLKYSFMLTICRCSG